MKEVLQEAIDAQANPQRMPKAFLLTHRHEHGSCPRCGAVLQKITLSSRGTYLYQFCQPNPG
jgi:formamidopyrimidine-DNA glycosylase